MEEFLARKYLWIDRNASPFFYRCSKWCQPFSQNGMERNSKNYGKKKLLFYGRTTKNGIRNFILSPTVF